MLQAADAKPLPSVQPQHIPHTTPRDDHVQDAPENTYKEPQTQRGCYESHAAVGVAESYEWRTCVLAPASGSAGAASGDHRYTSALAQALRPPSMAACTGSAQASGKAVTPPVATPSTPAVTARASSEPPAAVGAPCTDATAKEGGKEEAVQPAQREQLFVAADLLSCVAEDLRRASNSRVQALAGAAELGSLSECTPPQPHAAAFADPPVDAVRIAQWLASHTRPPPGGCGLGPPRALASSACPESSTPKALAEVLRELHTHTAPPAAAATMMQQLVLVLGKSCPKAAEDPASVLGNGVLLPQSKLCRLCTAGCSLLCERYACVFGTMQGYSIFAWLSGVRLALSKALKASQYAAKSGAAVSRECPHSRLWHWLLLVFSHLHSSGAPPLLVSGARRLACLDQARGWRALEQRKRTRQPANCAGLVDGPSVAISVLKKAIILGTASLALVTALQPMLCLLAGHAVLPTPQARAFVQLVYTLITHLCCPASTSPPATPADVTPATVLQVLVTGCPPLSNADPPGNPSTPVIRGLATAVATAVHMLAAALDQHELLFVSAGSMACTRELLEYDGVVVAADALLPEATPRAAAVAVRLHSIDCRFQELAAATALRKYAASLATL